YDADEGSPATVEVLITDPSGSLGEGADAWTFTVDMGDGTEPQPFVPHIDFPTQASANLLYAYDDEGDYEVTVTVVDDDGTEVSKHVTLSIANVAPTITDLGGDLSLGQGDTGAYTATATDPGDDVLTYTWDFDDDTEPVTGQDVTHAFAEPGTYGVVVAVSDGQDETSDGFKVVVADDVPPAVTGTDPSSVDAGGVFAGALGDIVLAFSEPLNRIDAVTPANYELVEAGPSGAFDDGDDVTYDLTPHYVTGETVVTLEIDAGLLPNGLYRLTARGEASLRDVAGNRLDGDGDGAEGGDYVRLFHGISAALWGGAFGSDWETSGNWWGDQVPGSSMTAVFDADTPNQPALLASGCVGHIDLRTAGWTVHGPGQTLMVGAGGIDSTGAGTNTVEPNVALADDSTWTVSGGNTLVLSGTLSGGDHTMTKDGDGTLVLSGGQDRSTGLSLTINGGTVRLGGGTLVLNDLFFGTGGGAADASASTTDQPAAAETAGIGDDTVTSSAGGEPLTDAILSPEVPILMKRSEAESVIAGQSVAGREAGAVSHAVPSPMLAAAVLGTAPSSSPPRVSQAPTNQDPVVGPVVTETAPLPAASDASTSEADDGLLNMLKPLDLLVPFGV
ncbi:MAG: PKD domain-containing protein, partial [Planctomycetota bacterium]|nr:PKD domain-containing protein [Planctomycetota bacterium]